ncbi:uncharacterized protein LOC123632557 isoform X5 [Lemur catta]|uniref:uncharacterized protein LOC123632557 isoform X5 n=1 Tax=Lemur catta TaxID=9447 RepID=UPI001E267903|nr:uncharacterized protein LOC123632557 isoform X5 [Lemur catta]
MHHHPNPLSLLLIHSSSFSCLDHSFGHTRHPHSGLGASILVPQVGGSLKSLLSHHSLPRCHFRLLRWAYPPCEKQVPSTHLPDSRSFCGQVVLHCTVSSFQAGNVFSLRQLLPPNTEAGPALGSGKPGRKRGAGELPPPQHLARRQALGQTPTPSHPPLRPQAGELLQACGSRWRPGMRLNTVQRSGQPQQQRTAQPSAVVETPALGKCKSRRDSHPAPHPQQQQPRD